MGQQSLIYSFVARGTVILADYTEFTGNFTGIAAQCLQKLPSSNNKFTYNCDGHTFNYLVDNGFSMILFLIFFCNFCLRFYFRFDLCGYRVCFLFVSSVPGIHSCVALTIDFVTV